MSATTGVACISFVDMPEGEDIEDGLIGPQEFGSLTEALNKAMAYVAQRLSLANHQEMDDEDKIRVLATYFIEQSRQECWISALSITGPNFSLQCGTLKALAL